MSVRIAMIAAGIVLATPLPAAADQLNIKPGAWEITTTAVASGIRLPAEALAKLSPEQRAKMEASMRAQDGKPVTQVEQSCVTQEELEQNTLLASDEGCARKIVASSATKIVIDETCPAPNVSSSRVTIEASAPDRIVMTMDRTQAGGGKIRADVKGRWLAASCAGIEEDE